MGGCGTCDSVLDVTLTTDSFPSETTWWLASLTDGCDLDASGGPYTVGFATIQETVPQLCSGAMYTFTMVDSWGDGSGEYVLSVNGVDVFSSDGSFTYAEATSFTVGQATFSPSPDPTMWPPPRITGARRVGGGAWEGRGLDQSKRRCR